MAAAPHHLTPQTIVRQARWCRFGRSVHNGSIPRTNFIFLLPDILACISYHLRCSPGSMIRSWCALDYNGDAESSNKLRPTSRPGHLQISVAKRQIRACCEFCCDQYTTIK